MRIIHSQGAIWGVSCLAQGHIGSAQVMRWYPSNSQPPSVLLVLKSKPKQGVDVCCNYFVLFLYQSELPKESENKQPLRKILVISKLTNC